MNKFENITELIVRIIIKRGNNVLLCKNKEHEHYFLTGGHVEFGDSLEQTIYKEMNEELGLLESDITKISFNNYLEGSYLNKEEKHCELNMIFNVEIKDDIEIKSQEDHIDFEWVNLDKISEVNLLPDGIKEFLNA
jgi:8-oxo-dGTP pyrophosphatase MutT (NUDIX family)